MADLPSPLALPRIHRLLRPLRASLSTILTSLTLAESRSRPAPPRDAKGKSKAVDLDYGSVPSRLKRPPTTTASSSPFQKAKRHKTSATYGSSRRPGTSERKEPRVRAESQPIDLARAGMDAELVVKVRHLVKAFRNCLECAYGVDRRGSGLDDSKRTGVVSLVESCARRVGEGVEEAVGVSFQDDDGEERSAFEDDGDQARLVDEWYEAVPPYARGWMLGHHATKIVLHGLEGVSLPVLLALVEAALFYGPVLALALSSAPSTLPSTASHLVPLAHLTAAPPTFFTALSSTLLSSTFSERLFFADFLDLARTPLYLEDTPTIAQLLVVLTEVAGCMLDAIDNLDDDESTERLRDEVFRRLETQLDRALPVLLNRPDMLGDLTAALDAFAWPERLSLLTTLHLAFAATTGVLDLLAPTLLDGPHLTALLSSISTQSLLTLSTLLHSSSLNALERQLLESAIEGYDDLVDVRTTKGQEVFSRQTFASLLELRGPAPSPEPAESEPEPEPEAPPKTPAKDPRQPSEPLAHSSLGRPFRLAKTLPTRARKARKAVVYVEPEDESDSDAESPPDDSELDERASELAESESEMNVEGPRSETDSDGGTLLGDLSSDEAPDSEDDATPQPTSDPSTRKPTEVIDLSLESDSESDQEFSKRILPRSALLLPPTSEPDDLDLLASARQVPVRRAGGGRGRKKRVSASSDELGM